MAQSAAPYPPEDKSQGSDQRSLYTDFDTFLKVAIREYYDMGWSKRKGNFIALLIASGQTAVAMAKDSVVDGAGSKKIAIGAAMVLALRVGLRYAIGGPLGLVLTVAASASMISYFLKNQKDIIKKVSGYKVLIADVQQQYSSVYNDWRSGKLDSKDRNLMIDGLMKRFLEQADVL